MIFEEPEEPEVREENDEILEPPNYDDIIYGDVVTDCVDFMNMNRRFVFVERYDREEDGPRFHVRESPLLYFKDSWDKNSDPLTGDIFVKDFKTIVTRITDSDLTSEEVDEIIDSVRSSRNHRFLETLLVILDEIADEIRHGEIDRKDLESSKNDIRERLMKCLPDILEERDKRNRKKKVVTDKTTTKKEEDAMSGLALNGAAVKSDLETKRDMESLVANCKGVIDEATHPVVLEWFGIKVPDLGVKLIPTPLAAYFAVIAYLLDIIGKYRWIREWEELIEGKSVPSKFVLKGDPLKLLKKTYEGNRYIASRVLNSDGWSKFEVMMRILRDAHPIISSDALKQYPKVYNIVANLDTNLHQEIVLHPKIGLLASYAAEANPGMDSDQASALAAMIIGDNAPELLTLGQFLKELKQHTPVSQGQETQKDETAMMRKPQESDRTNPNIVSEIVRRTFAPIPKNVIIGLQKLNVNLHAELPCIKLRYLDLDSENGFGTRKLFGDNIVLVRELLSAAATDIGIAKLRQVSRIESIRMVTKHPHVTIGLEQLFCLDNDTKCITDETLEDLFNWANEVRTSFVAPGEYRDKEEDDVNGTHRVYMITDFSARDRALGAKLVQAGWYRVDIEQALGRTRTSVTRMVNRLMKDGLIRDTKVALSEKPEEGAYLRGARPVLTVLEKPVVNDKKEKEIKVGTQKEQYGKAWSDVDDENLIKALATTVGKSWLGIARTVGRRKSACQDRARALLSDKINGPVTFKAAVNIAKQVVGDLPKKPSQVKLKKTEKVEVSDPNSLVRQLEELTEQARGLVSKASSDASSKKTESVLRLRLKGVSMKEICEKMGMSLEEVVEIIDAPIQ
jgi:hypothetical protein